MSVFTRVLQEVVLVVVHEDVLHEVVLVVVHEDVSQEGIVGEEIETQRPPGPSSLLLGIVCH